MLTALLLAGVVMLMLWLFKGGFKGRLQVRYQAGPLCFGWENGSGKIIFQGCAANIPRGVPVIGALN